MRAFWWDIYGTFESANDSDPGCISPHAGQVIHCYRKLRRCTRTEVAEALGWSDPEILRIESSPDGPGSLARSLLLSRHLHIPPALLSLPFEQALPDLAAESQHGPGHRRALNIHPFLGRGDSLSDEAEWLCGHTLDMCTNIFIALGPEDSPPITGAARLARILEARRTNPHAQPYMLTTSTEQIRLGLNSIDYWLKCFRYAGKHSTSLRRAQYLYYQQCFASIACLTLQLIDNAKISDERRLHYGTEALLCARELENVELISSSLISRAKTLLEQREDALALQDAEETLFYIEIESEVFVQSCSATVFALRELLRSAEGYTNRRLLEIVNEAMRIAQITHDDLNPWGWSEIVG